MYIISYIKHQTSDIIHHTSYQIHIKCISMYINSYHIIDVWCLIWYQFDMISIDIPIHISYIISMYISSYHIKSPFFMDSPHSPWRQAHLEDRIEESWEAALAKPPDLTKKTTQVIMGMEPLFPFFGVGNSCNHQICGNRKKRIVAW